MAEEQVWTVKSTLDWIIGYLDRHGDANARLSAQWLMSEATGLSRLELYTNMEQPLTMDERERLRAWVSRRGKGEPLQYITGEAPFRYITVKVRPGVLIPRPETEVLVSEALGLLPAYHRRRAADSLLNEYEGAMLIAASAEQAASPLASPDAPAEQAAPLVAPAERVASPLASLVPTGETLDGGSQASFQVPGDGVSSGRHNAAESGETPRSASPPTFLVADICTGSGCVACSMAYERPDVSVLATDIAPEAVALARENAAALGLQDRIDIIQCDLGAGIDPELLGSFDLVVSNPPYVPTAVLSEIPAEVTAFEPVLALDGGTDGLDLYRRLLDFCRRALKPGGSFAMELHETCLDDAADLARQAGFQHIRIVYDLNDRPRVITARKA